MFLLSFRTISVILFVRRASYPISFSLESDREASGNDRVMEEMRKQHHNWDLEMEQGGGST